MSHPELEPKSLKFQPSTFIHITNLVPVNKAECFSAIISSVPSSSPSSASQNFFCLSALFSIHICIWMYFIMYNLYPWTSLVAQWLRIRLPMQGPQVRALVREDPTCRRTTKPVRHNYWACTLEPASHNYWARAQQQLKPTRLEPVLRNEKPPQWEARTL